MDDLQIGDIFRIKNDSSYYLFQELENVNGSDYMVCMESKIYQNNMIISHKYIQINAFFIDKLSPNEEDRCEIHFDLLIKFYEIKITNMINNLIKVLNNEQE
jgi:hypothetical protein